MGIKIPDIWGKDSLSRFISAAYHNCIGSFINYKDLPIMNAVKEVDALFHKAVHIEYKPKEELLLPTFVGRSHCAYLVSIQLSTAGQVPEAYPVIRLCLENTLYALHIQADPTLSEEIPERTKIWVDRGLNDEATQKCRRMFSYRNVKENLIKKDQKLGQHASALYERTINYGAHPNFYGHATTGNITETGGKIQYLLPNTKACRLCIQTAVEVGICSLKIYGLILEGRFETAGITERVQKIDWKNQNVERR